jgi:Domain of unknown function (DUF3850)
MNMHPDIKISEWPPQVPGELLKEVPSNIAEQPTELPPPSDRKKTALEVLLENARKVEEAVLSASLVLGHREGFPELARAIDELTRSRRELERSFGPLVHHLKCDPEMFNAVKGGRKFCEVRVFDRDYRIGDYLVLSAYDRAERRYTGENMRVQVTHIVAPGTYGLPLDVGVMSIEPA